MKTKWYSFLIVGLVSLIAISVVGCQAPPTIAFSPSSLSFNAQHGETDLVTGTLHISNSGGGTLDWLVSSDAYDVDLSPSNDSSTGEADKVRVSVDISGFSVGNYEATITIFANGAANTPQTVPVKINITKNPRYVYTNGAIEVGADGEPIELINNPNTTNPSYDELVAFIKSDTTDAIGYVEEGMRAYICTDFAEALHNNAEEAGIRAAWVGINFEDDDKGHALNAFETTDRGLVYIDCTGRDASSQSVVLSRYPVKTEDGFSSQDKMAYVEIGKEYGSIDITKAKPLSYGFYEEYKQKWQECEELFTDYNGEVTRFKHQCSSYEERLSNYNNMVRRFNKGLELWPYIVSSDQAMLLLQVGERQFLEEERTILKVWQAKLETCEATLEKKGQEIDELAEELGDYWYEPLGIVRDIQIHWGKE